MPSRKIPASIISNAEWRQLAELATAEAECALQIAREKQAKIKRLRAEVFRLQQALEQVRILSDRATVQPITTDAQRALVDITCFIDGVINDGEDD